MMPINSGMVPGTKVGFPPRKGGPTAAPEQKLPTHIVKDIPAGPLRYRTGDPLAVLTFATDGRNRTVEAHTAWENRDDLVHAVRGYSSEKSPLNFRQALKVAFDRSGDHRAQAVLQAEDGSYWISRLSTEAAEPLRIDGATVPKDTAVTGVKEEEDLVAVIGRDRILNFSDRPVYKPRWWDFLIGRT